MAGQYYARHSGRLPPFSPSKFQHAFKSSCRIFLHDPIEQGASNEE